MAHSKQAAKRNRQNIKAREKNKQQRTAFKSAIKITVSADSPSKMKAALPLAMKKVDKAAKNRVIHKNAAARLKSRLAKKVSKAAKAK